MAGYNIFKQSNISNVSVEYLMMFNERYVVKRWQYGCKMSTTYLSEINNKFENS